MTIGTRFSAWEARSAPPSPRVAAQKGSGRLGALPLPLLLLLHERFRERLLAASRWRSRFQGRVLSRRRPYSPSRYRAFSLPESERNPGPVESRWTGDNTWLATPLPGHAHRQGPDTGQQGLTRDGSSSCSICRSFLLFSSSRRRSFVRIRSTSLFCTCNDWRKKGPQHPRVHTHPGRHRARTTCTHTCTRTPGQTLSKEKGELKTTVNNRL